ncbi:MAG: hypothetical protein CMO55_09050 [Verrucomicrobiales bacterium]|nr:hypothetical protein [Verrucomicrobiales bacterium]
MANGFQIPSLQKYVATILAALAFSMVQSEDVARRVGVILEGTFETHEVNQALEGAKLTQIVPFYEWDYGVRSFSEEMWNERGFEWESFFSIATKVADTLVEKIEPTVYRDRRGVIDYITIADEDPFLTSIVFSSAFHEKFRDALGDRIFVIPIDRHRLHLFPATGGKLEFNGPKIVEEFRQTELPVSLEVLLVDKDGVQVVGELER